MGSLGSASIQLTLDRSRFDSDLKKLQATDAGQIAYRIKLDIKDFERQIKGLSKLVSPVFIPLEIDTKTFDQQIKKLSTSIDPIKVDLAPNVKDFQEKLRRLSKITPVTVDIKVDEALVRQQFETIGKYAAEGFTQGFSGVEGAGKSAIDSMVKSVNKQLGIQSPSKVFRDIGKFAIAGLMQGLDSVDESKLKGVVNKIEGYFKKSKIRVDVDVNSGDFNPLKNITSAGIGEKITSAIEDGFKKSRPKPPSTFSKIFSGIGDTLLAPLKGITTGAFEGVGLQLSKQLGAGLGRGIESQLGPIIGSFDLLGEKLITSAIPKLGNTVGGKIAGAILNSAPLQKLKADLTGQITSIVGESEQLIASQAGKNQNRQRQQQQQKLSQRELGLQLQTAIANAPQRQQQAQQIKQKILPQYQQEVKSKSSQLSTLQADRELLVATGTETEEIKLAVDKIDLQIAQASSALVEAKKAEQFLQQQIAGLLGETNGAVGKLKMAGANTSGVDNVEFALIESAVKANGIVTRLDGNIKIQQENIKEARVRLKAYKQEEARLKAEAIVAVQSGDEVGAKSLLGDAKNARFKTFVAQQEISAYKTNISENLKIKQESAGEFVQERKRLKNSLDQERAALAARVVQSEEVQPQRRLRAKPEKAKQALITQVEDLVKQPAAVITPPAPQIFQDVLAQFQQLSGIKIPANKIPQLVRGPEKAGFTGKYNSVDNAVTLPSGRYDQLSKGVVSPDVIKTLVHELRHAMQTGFGQRTISQSGNPEFQLIKGTPQEQQQLGSKIQASADFFKKGALGATSSDVEVVKSLEEDAYVFAERYFEQVFKSIQQGLKSGIKSGGVPTEAELLKQVQATQATITANLKQSFKGKPSDRKVTNPELAGSTLTNIDKQIALVGEQLKRTDLSGEARQKLGQFKGTIERQYRTYSPALRAKQTGSSSLGLAQAQGVGQSQGVELFEVSDEALRDFERQTRAAERRAKNVLKGIFKNSNRAAKRANKALEQLEQETNQQVAGIETGVAYDEAYSSRRTRRTIKKIQRGYGGNIDAPTIETDAPRVESDLPKLPERSFFKGLGKEFRLARVSALTKQAEYLGQQAQVLLTDIDAQIALGKAQEKEAQLIQKQIQQNERRLNAVLNQIKRAQSGKDPKLTSGDLQRLSGKAEDLTGRIDADKQRLALVQPNIKNGRELEPVAKNLRGAIAGASDASKQQNIKELEKQNSLIRENLKLLGEPPPPRNPFDVILGGADKFRQMLPNIFTLLKGVLAFQVSSFLQGFFTNLATDAFKAFVELDRLKTALNFASGGTAGGAQNLAFVRKTVDDLKIPLKSSTEGFVGLAAAARGTSLEGKGTRELFLGMADASTVLSLSSEQTSRAFLALQQALSKGKLSSEEMRQQLAESGLTGALGIAARAMGVTEQEFSRLLDTGQIISENFLPKFSKQLQAEFGDAAKDASGNAQSAIFGVENAFLSLQQGVGEGIAPAATAGLNVFAVVLKGIASVAKELGFILLSVSLVLSGKMLSALGAVLSEMIKVNFAQVGLTGGMKAFGQTINNSASVQWAAGIFAVLEVVKLLNDAVNTDLVKSFNEAAKAAKKTAEEAANAYKKASKPESSNGFGKLADDFLISPIRNNAQQIKSNPVTSFLAGAAASYVPGGAIALNKASKLQTFGELERDTTIKDINDLSDETKNFLAAARVRLQGLKNGTGKTGQLPKVDAELLDAEQQRQITQAQIKRDFTDKGKAIPAEFRQKRQEQDEQIKKLNDKRAEIAKPITLDSTKTDQYVNSIKALLEVLDDPKAVTALGGVEAVEKLKIKLKEIAAPAKEFKADLDASLASLRVDPIRAFTQALRGLNLALAEGQEKNKENLSKRKLTNSREAIAGFSSNKLATKQLAFKNADDEYKSAQIDEANSASSVKTYEEAASKPDFQTTLKRLGLTPDASVAKIDDVLKNTTDEADKGILEKLKAGRESKAKLPEIQAATLEAKTKRSQVVQDNAFFKIDDSAANSRAATQKAENQKITAVKNAQAARLITEEVAAEKISRIGLQSTRSQQKNLNQQLQALRAYHDQGAISAEKFDEKQRELTTQQTELEKQEAENRLAVQQAVLARRLKDIEFVNKKAESVIALSSTNATTKAKEKLLAAGLTPQAQDQFNLEKAAIDQKGASDDANLIKARMAQNKQLYKEGLRDAREFMLEQMALNVELGKANQSVIDQKIAAENQYREAVEHAIGRIMQAEENRFKSLTSQLDFQKAGLDLYNQSLERTGKLEESRYNLAKALTDAATAPLETKRDNANRALDLSRKLKDDNLDPGVRSVVSSQLSQMGFGTNELAILAQRNRIEDEIAAKKLESLKLEQEYQRKALQLDLQRQRIAAETAVYDAESAKLAAAKSKLEAEGAMRIAQIKKDPDAIKSAEVGLEIAGREAELSDKRLDNAQKNLGIQDELAKNATMAQETTQRTAIDQQLATDKARKQGEGVEKAEAAAPKNVGEEQSGKKDKGKRRGRRRGMIGETFVENGRTFKDGIDVTNYHYDEALNIEQGNPRAPGTDPVEAIGAMKPGVPVTSSLGLGLELPKGNNALAMPNLDLKPGENLFDAYQRQREGIKLSTQGTALPSSKADIPPVDTTAMHALQANIQPRETTGGNQFVEALKMANQGIEQRLDALRGAIMTLANTPRSISISSPNPIDDTADFMNRISRGQVVAAGA
ncbi:tape measure protein [Nostoc sp.]|uniref:tape measure protein n=1 Tax=Nostoc sp. TaxID=1180 RepID=UPI002FEF0BE3